MIPKIVERKITKMQKPGGLTQYIITLPKEYGEALNKEGIDTLLIVYNRGLGGFPAIPGFTEEALLAFLSQHPELQRLFSQIEVTQSEKKSASEKGVCK